MPTTLCQAHCLPDTRRLISQASSGHPRRKTGLRTLAPRGPRAGGGQGPVAADTLSSCFSDATQKPQVCKGGSSTAFNLGTASRALTMISLQTGGSPRVPDWIGISGLPNRQRRPHKVEKLPISAGFLICTVSTRPTARLPAVPQPLCVCLMWFTHAVLVSSPGGGQTAGSQRPDRARRPVL